MEMRQRLGVEEKGRGKSGFSVYLGAVNRGSNVSLCSLDLKFNFSI